MIKAPLEEMKMNSQSGVPVRSNELTRAVVRMNKMRPVYKRARWQGDRSITCRWVMMTLTLLPPSDADKLKAGQR